MNQVLEKPLSLRNWVQTQAPIILPTEPNKVFKADLGDSLTLFEKFFHGQIEKGALVNHPDDGWLLEFKDEVHNHIFIRVQPSGTTIFTTLEVRTLKHSWCEFSSLETLRLTIQSFDPAPF